MNNSVLFMLAVRKTLSEFLNYSRLDNKAKKLSRHFIMFEASDYEIMSLLLTGDYPSEKYNPLKEEKLFNRYKNIVLENFSELEPLVGKNILKNVITEITPSKSSSNVLLKTFLNEQDSKSSDSKTIKTIAGTAALTGFFNNIGKGAYLYARDKAKIGLAPLISYLKTTNGRRVGSAMAASLIIFASIVVYNKYFSSTARACLSLKGVDRENCIRKIKINALQNQINALKQGMNVCATKENRIKCEQVIKVKIIKLQLKIQKLRN